MQANLVAQIELAPGIEAARRARFPLGAAIEFADLDVHGRVAALDGLRASEPMSWLPAIGGWLVTSHALARDLLGRREGFTVEAEPNLVRASLGAMMLTSDGLSHERQRAPFEEPFRMRAVRERFDAPVRVRVDELVAALAPNGECELASEFAAPFAIGVAGDILGLGLDDVPRIRGFYDAFAGAMVYDGDPEPQRRADAARAALDSILQRELARVRGTGQRSITAAVATQSAGLTDDEIVAQLRVILFGAIETVESMVLNTVLLLLEHPTELATVRSEGALGANAIEEAMRLIPPVAFIERWTSAPTRLGEVELGPGEFVGVSTLAANRDPAVFPDPLRCDVRRENARLHLALSFGRHHCLGFNMARMQGAIALGGLLDALPGLALVEAPEPTGFAFRKPAMLRVRWG